MDRFTRVRSGIGSLLLFGLGLLTALAQPPLWILPTLWMAYPLALLLILSRRGWRGAGLFIFMFWWGQIVGGMYWLGWVVGVDLATYWWVTPFAILGLPAFLALVQMPWWLAAWLVVRRFDLGMSGAVLIFAGAAMGAEGFRGWAMTGLPWGPLGTVWGFHPLTMQLSAWIGVFGLTALTTASAAGPALFAVRRPGQALAVTAVPLLLLIGFGAWRLPTVSAQAATPTQTVVRLVQPGTNALVRLDDRAKQQRVRDLLALTFSGEGHHDVAIWSETSIQFFIDHFPEDLAWVIENFPPDARIITGGLGASPGANPIPTNTAYVLTNDGIQARHDKSHLVPFGEYKPWFVRWIPIAAFSAGSFWEGPGLSTWSLPGLPPVSPLICYEMIFPGAVIAPDGPRPEWMVNISNDGWYGNTSGPRQHFTFARFRAVEEGLPMVRVGGTGISGVIDAAGVVHHRIAYGATEVINLPLPQPLGITPFGQNSRLSFWIVVLALILSGFTLGLAKNRKNLPPKM